MFIVAIERIQPPVLHLPAVGCTRINNHRPIISLTTCCE
jgi:hypothetical protein